MGDAFNMQEKEEKIIKKILVKRLLLDNSLTGERNKKYTPVLMGGLPCCRLLIRRMLFVYEVV